MPIDEHDIVMPANSVTRVVLASLIGTTIEWYDFFLYGTAAALVFNRLFFPTLDPLAGTMASFATYAVGFFARPVGGIVFGHFGDRMGRKSMLVTTLMLMGLATFLIGILPTYAQVGVAAPVLLVILRFVQGFGVGGEWGGAVLMVVEHGHRGQRGLYASWVQAGVPAGLLLANAVFILFSLLPDEAFLSWGWRVPFLLGIALLGVGLFIRLQIVESPLFAQVLARKEQSRVPFFEVLRRHPRNVLLAMGARMADNGTFYIFTVFVLTYTTSRTGRAKNVGLKWSTHRRSSAVLCHPCVWHLVGPHWPTPRIYGGAAAIAAFAFPFFWMLNTGNTVLIGLAIVIALVRACGHVRPTSSLLFRAIWHQCPIYGGIDRLSIGLAAGRRPGPVDFDSTARMERRQIMAGRRLHDHPLERNARLGLAGRRDVPRPTRRSGRERLNFRLAFDHARRCWRFKVAVSHR